MMLYIYTDSRITRVTRSQAHGWRGGYDYWAKIDGGPEINVFDAGNRNFYAAMGDDTTEAGCAEILITLVGDDDAAEMVAKHGTAARALDALDAHDPVFTLYTFDADELAQDDEQQ